MEACEKLVRIFIYISPSPPPTANKTSALHFCHSFLRKFIHLSRTPLFQPYQWFCPGTYQPLHATMILLLDLHERPFMPEAAKSRSFIDQVFAVFGEHGNYNTGDGEGGSRPLIEGGREAWRMLWRLRKKAYEKAGVPVPEAPDDPGSPPLEPTVCSEYAHTARYPTTPPLPPQTPQTAPPLPPGGFEELLHMDTIIDAEDKAFFTDEMTANFAGGRLLTPRTVTMTAPVLAAEKEEETAAAPPTPQQMETLFVPESIPESAGEEEEDLMDFNWEEWDQVFGKSVYVDDGLGL